MKETLNFEKTCCFTGHRMIAAAAMPELKAQLEKTLDDLLARGVGRYICGGALGFDTLAAQTVLEKKREYPWIKLIIAAPCADQSARWSEKQKKTYQEILDAADEVTVLFDRYVTGCMHFRDAFMVDHSDVLVAYYRGRPGGTQYTFLYAESRGLEIINL